MATAFFMQMIIEMTDADIDQEHIEMLVYNCPWIPDRTSYILGDSNENPAPDMIAVGKKLAEQNVDLIAIPCITAHYFYRELSDGICVPIINTIEEVCNYLVDCGYDSVGLMATSGTVASELFNKCFEDHGCKIVLPNDELQKDVMHLIYDNIKASKPVDMECFERVSEGLRQEGAQVIVLGCTELSMIRRDFSIGEGYLDAMQLMAKCAVEQCGKLKPEYIDLITRAQEVIV